MQRYHVLDFSFLCDYVRNPSFCPKSALFFFDVLKLHKLHMVFFMTSVKPFEFDLYTTIDNFEKKIEPIVRELNGEVPFVCDVLICGVARFTKDVYLFYVVSESEDSSFTENFIKTVLQKYPELVAIDVKTKYDRIIYFIKNSARKV